MSTIRVRFTRGEEVRFISHLDLMKVFERALRRSGLPIAYSQGFNPHPQMVFGLPLSVGVTSTAEYADFELDRDVKPFEFMEKLNAELPEGIKISGAAKKDSKGNIMASIKGAVYDIAIFIWDNISIENIKEKVSAFLQKDAVIIKKEGKRGVREVDIKPMIDRIEINSVHRVPAGYEEFKTVFTITASLRAGSESNLKPELLIAALSQETGIHVGTANIHRSELYVQNAGRMANPLDEAVLEVN